MIGTDGARLSAGFGIIGDVDFDSPNTNSGDDPAVQIYVGHVQYPEKVRPN